MEKLEVLIDSLKNVKRGQTIRDVDVSQQYKEDIFCDLYKKEFIRKFYSLR